MMRVHPRAALPALLILALAAGCEGEKRVMAKKPGTGSSSAKAAPKPQVIQPREILGKTTQDIRPAEPELQGGGAREAPNKVTAKDPITLGGNVYVVAIDRTAANNVQHALDLYNAEHGAYPRNHDEFMAEVIKPGQPDGVVLPRLPYYQEYSYDAKQHKLIILEYPDRKNQFQKQQDARFGR